MSEQDKHKTKTVILRELESIKGLLLDDDDIPLLQEVIESAEEQTGVQETLDGDDLAELHQAYRDLLQAREPEPEFTAEEAGEAEPPILHDIEEDARAPEDTRPENPSGSEKAPRAEVQTSLFDADNELSEPAPDTTAPRRSVTKASGENPFLPAHIRERLHGNRPPPLFEPPPPLGQKQTTPVDENKPAPTITEPERTEPERTEPERTDPGNPSIDRMQLVEQVVTSLLPEVAAKLRHTLQALDAEQLQQLLDDKPAPDEPD